MVRGGNSSGVHLTDIVKVSMRDFFLCRQLLHLVQQDVHLELGAQILQAAVAEGLPAAEGHNVWLVSGWLNVKIRHKTGSLKVKLTPAR